MIAFLKGRLAGKTAATAFIDVNAVSYTHLQAGCHVIIIEHQTAYFIFPPHI